MAVTISGSAPAARSPTAPVEQTAVQPVSDDVLEQVEVAGAAAQQPSSIALTPMQEEPVAVNPGDFVDQETGIQHINIGGQRPPEGEGAPRLDASGDDFIAEVEDPRDVGAVFEDNKGIGTDIYQSMLDDQPEADFESTELVIDPDTKERKLYGVYDSGTKSHLIKVDPALDPGEVPGDTRSTADKILQTAIHGTGVGMISGVLEIVQFSRWMTGNDRSKVIDQYIAKLTAQVKRTAGGDKNAEIAGDVAKLISEFALPFTAAIKGLRALGMAPLVAETLAEVIVGFIALNPDDGTLADLLPEAIGILDLKPMKDFLSIDPDDSELEKRAKQALIAAIAVGGGMVLWSGVINAIKLLKKKAKRAGTAAGVALIISSDEVKAALTEGEDTDTEELDGIPVEDAASRKEGEDLLQVASRVGVLLNIADIIGTASKSVLKLQKRMPLEDRVAGGFNPLDSGLPRRDINGQPYKSKDLTALGGGARFDQIDIDRMWEEALAETGEDAVKLVRALEEQGKIFMPKGLDFWNRAMRLPDRSRYWYEISAEGIQERMVHLSRDALIRFLDVLAATSPMAKPQDNMRRALVAFSQDVRGMPLDSDLTNVGAVRAVLTGSENAGLKTNSFSGTMKFHLGLTDTPPLSTNDRQVASAFGIEGDDIANNDVAYEILSRFYQKMRNQQNSGLTEGQEMYETWQLQALGWVQERLDKGIPSGDDYLQSLDNLAVELNKAGIETPGGLITKDVMEDPRFDTVLARTLERHRASPKATVEMVTKRKRVGKDTDALMALARRYGDDVAVRAHEKIVQEHLRGLIKSIAAKKATKTSPAVKGQRSIIQRAVDIVVGNRKPDNKLSRATIEHGTFEGVLSAHARIPLPPGLTKAQRESVLAFMGMALRQDVMAASSFIDVADAAPVAEGAVRTFKVFLQGVRELDAKTIHAFENALAKRGVGKDDFDHTVNIERLANGVVIEINPRAVNDVMTGPVISEVHAALKAIGVDPGLVRVSSADYVSDFLVHGQYAGKIASLRKAALNGEASDIKDLFDGDIKRAREAIQGGGAFDERDAFRRKSSLSDGDARRVEEARRKFRKRLEGISGATEPARELSDRLLAAQEKWGAQFGKRLREQEALEAGNIGPGASLIAPGTFDDALDEEEEFAGGKLPQAFKEFQVAGGLVSVIDRLFGKQIKKLFEVKKGTKEQYLKDMPQDVRDVYEFDAFFEGYDGKSVPQKDVLDHVSRHGGLKETILGGPPKSGANTSAFEIFDTRTGDVVSHADTAEEAEQFIRSTAGGRTLDYDDNADLGGIARTQFHGDELSLSGGENYTEILVQAPERITPDVKDNNIKFLQSRIKQNTDFLDAVLLNADANDLSKLDRAELIQDTIDKNAKLQSRLDITRNTPAGDNYTQGHFDDHDNVLVHVRASDHVTSMRGDDLPYSVLHVDEWQSDLHQMGAKIGYQGGAPDPSKWKVDRGSVAAEPGTLDTLRGRSAPITSFARIWDAEGNLLGRYSIRGTNISDADILKRAAKDPDLLKAWNMNAVPDMPYKGNAWKVLGAKRAIAEAVDRGHSGMTWTKGAQQTKRYSDLLRKNVDEIRWAKTPDGVHLVGYKGAELTAGQAQILTRFRNQRANPDTPLSVAERRLVERLELQDTGLKKVLDTTEKENALSIAVGKAMSDDILGSSAQSGVIRGSKMRIDDTGMAVFYDRIQVSNVNKLVKKYGIKTKNAVLSRPARVSGSDVLNARGVHPSQHEKVWDSMTIEERSAAIIKHQMEESTVNGIVFTDKLIAAVKNGTFTVGAATALNAALTGDAEATATGPDILRMMADPEDPAAETPEGEEEVQVAGKYQTIFEGIKMMAAGIARSGKLAVQKAAPKPILSRTEAWKVKRATLSPASPGEGERFLEGTAAERAARIAEAEATGNPADIIGVDINFDNLHTSDDLKATINEISEIYKTEITAEKRGVIGHNSTAAMADELDMLPSVFARKVGTLWNAEEMYAARVLMVRSAKRTDELADAARGANAGDVDQLAFRRQLAMHALIVMRVKGVQTEIARALGAMRMPVGGDGKPDLDQIDALLTQLGGRVNTRQLAERWTQINDPSAKNKLAIGSAWSRSKEAWMTVWINGLLSSPMTQVRNVVGNMVFQAWKIPETIVAAGIGSTRRAFLPNSNPERMFAMEAVADIYGMVASIKGAFITAAKTVRTGMPQDPLAKMEAMRPRAISGASFNQAGWFGQAIDLMGSFIEIPGRFLMAGDDFFKATARNGAKHALAYRQAQQAMREGASATDAADIMANQIKNPDAAMIESIEDAARYYTFTNELDKFGKLIQKGQEFAVFRIVSPFVRTPANIGKAFIARGPLAPFLKPVRDAIKAGGAQADLAMARVALGTATMIYATTLAMDGHITGRGPSDRQQRATLQATGWQKYSWYIPNDAEGNSGLENATIELLEQLGVPFSVSDEGVYISYAGIEPIGLMFSVASDTFDAMKWSTEPGAADNLAAAAVMSMYENMKDRSFFEGISQFSRAASEGKGFLNAYIRNLARSGAIIPKPYSSLLNRIENVMDPVKKDPRVDPNLPMGHRAWLSVYNAWVANIPYFNKDLPDVRNIWGDTVQIGKGKWYEAVNPFYISVAKYSPVERELIRLDSPISEVPRRIQGIALSPEQYSRYKQLVGKDIPPRARVNLKEQLMAQIDNPKSKYNNDAIYNDLERIKYVRAIYRTYVQHAQREMLIAYPKLEERIRMNQDLKDAGQMKNPTSRFLQPVRSGASGNPAAPQ